MAKRILLTGANGFIGSHILDQLLAQGHSVHAIVRSESKSAQVSKDFPSPSPGKLDFGIVPDITSSGAFTHVITSSPPFDLVVHTASPFLYRAVSTNLEFLDPAIKGTTELLKAVKEHAPSVKRVVITSSCAAVVDFAAPFVSPGGRKVYSEEDWNPISWERALEGTPNAAYQASKKFAEQAAWDFVKNEKPNFDLVTLCPPMVYGPIRHSIDSVKELNESNGRIYNLFINTKKDAPMPPNGLHIYTDVRDIAHAHLLAAFTPAASGQRFVISTSTISSQQISDILRSKIPELAERTPIGQPGTKGLDEGIFTASSAKAERVLGWKFRGAEETFVDLGVQLLEIEGKSK